MAGIAAFREEMVRALKFALLALALGAACPAAIAAAPAQTGRGAATATAPAATATQVARPAQATAVAIPAPAPALTDTQIDDAVTTLKDPAKREALIATLEAMKRGGSVAAKPAVAATGKKAGAGNEVVRKVQEKAETGLSTIGKSLKAATDVSLIWHWLEFVATDVWLRQTVIETAWRFAAVMAAALAAEYLVGFALRRSRAAVRGGAARSRGNDIPEDGDGIAAAEAGQTEPSSRRSRRLRRWLGRLPRALGHFGLELVPVLGFAVAGFILLSSGLAHDRVSHLVIAASLEAYLVCRLVMEFVRLLVAPGAPAIRLVPLSDERAAWLAGWLRIIVGTIAFGYAAIATGDLFGLYPAASRVLIKLVSLAVHIMLAIMVLQVRRPVAAFIQGDGSAGGLVGTMRSGLARTWHILALFYVIALWVVWAIGVPHAPVIMLRVVAVLGAVIVLARSLATGIATGLDTLFDESSPLHAQHPELHQRMRVYVPVFKLAVAGLIAVLAVLVTLQLWGLGIFGWLVGTSVGQRFVSAAITIGVAILIALVVWEAANVALEAQAERLARQGRAARAARYRTLLPMLRTTLLVAILMVVALVVLSAVGVNVTLLLGGLSIFGLAVGFGSQKLVQDVITGLFLLLEDAVQVGDYVNLGGVSGTVEKLSIRTIRLRSLDGSLNVIPFSAVSTVANYSREFSFAPINIGVAYKEDIDRVFAVVREEFGKMRAEPDWEEKIIGELELWGLDQFGASSLDIVGRMRTLAGQQNAVRREFNRRIKIRFDAEGIEIPFTYQRLTIDPAEFRAAFVRDATPPRASDAPAPRPPEPGAPAPGSPNG